MKEVSIFGATSTKKEHFFEGIPEVNEKKHMKNNPLRGIQWYGKEQRLRWLRSKNKK